MSIFPEISRRARDMYHNLQDDDIIRNIFNSGRHKDKVGMQISDWMITKEMKHTEHYRMYAEVFGLDVPLIQSQPTESTQGTHRTPSAPRSPTPKKDTAESSAPKRSTVDRFPPSLPERRSNKRLTPPALVALFNEEEQCPSTSGNQQQEDDYDFWTDSYGSDDDEIPSKQVSQDIMEEASLTIDETKLKKMADEMLRQRCTSGDEHQYHIDQMKNFLKSDIVWESRKEIFCLSTTTERHTSRSIS
ncbi:hypothetical protein Tco_0576812 [Tanacetum coccineum]